VVPLVKTEDETELEEMLASEVGPAVEDDEPDSPLDDWVTGIEVEAVEFAKLLDDWVTGTEAEAVEFTKLLDEAELDRIADVVPLEKLLDTAVLLVEAADDAVVVELFCAARDSTMAKSVPGAEVLLFWSIPLK